MNRKVFFLFLGVFLFFFLTRTLSHYNLWTSFYDQYFFDNPLWNTVQGRLMFSSVEKTSFLGNHFSPVLFIFALPYFIYPSPLWSFAFQALFASLIFVLLYKFGLESLTLKEQPLLLFLLLTNLTLRSIGVNDFHMDVVLAFLVSLATYYLLKNHLGRAIFCILLGFFVKETAGFIIASFGLYLLLLRKEKIWGAFLLVGGLIGTFIVVNSIIPLFNPQNIYKFTHYYSHFGKNFTEQVVYILSHPFEVLKATASLANLRYFILLLSPLAFLPLLRVKTLILIFFPVLQNFLSNYFPQKEVYSQYSYVIVPVIFFAALLAIKQLKEKNFWEKQKKWIFPFIFLVGLYSVVSSFVFLELRWYLPTPKVFSAHQIMKTIPKEASLSASTHLLVHLQYRSKLYLFPNINNAEYVIYEGFTRWLPLEEKEREAALKKLWKEKNYWWVLNYIFFGEVTTSPVSKKEYAAAIHKLQTNKNYSLLKAENGIYLYQRKR